MTTFMHHTITDAHFESPWRVRVQYIRHPTKAARARTIEWARLMNRGRVLVHIRAHKLVDRRPVQCRCRMGALAAFIIGALVVVLRVVGAGRATAVAGGDHACHMHAHYTAYLIDGQ